jgi:hypothetical protein
MHSLSLSLYIYKKITYVKTKDFILRISEMVPNQKTVYIFLLPDYLLNNLPNFLS